MDPDLQLPNASRDSQGLHVVHLNLHQDQDWNKFGRDSQVLLEHDKAVYLTLG